jgi:hypothetical protein
VCEECIHKTFKGRAHLRRHDKPLFRLIWVQFTGQRTFFN